MFGRNSRNWFSKAFSTLSVQLVWSYDKWYIFGACRTPLATGTSKEITFLQHIHRSSWVSWNHWWGAHQYNQHRGEIHQINRIFSTPNLQEESGRLAVSWKSGLARITWMFTEKKVDFPILTASEKGRTPFHLVWHVMKNPFTKPNGFFMGVILPKDQPCHQARCHHSHHMCAGKYLAWPGHEWRGNVPSWSIWDIYSDPAKTACKPLQCWWKTSCRQVFNPKRNKLMSLDNQYWFWSHTPWMYNVPIPIFCQFKY